MIYTAPPTEVRDQSGTVVYTGNNPIAWAFEHGEERCYLRLRPGRYPPPGITRQMRPAEVRGVNESDEPLDASASSEGIVTIVGNPYGAGTIDPFVAVEVLSGNDAESALGQVVVGPLVVPCRGAGNRHSAKPSPPAAGACPRRCRQMAMVELAVSRWVKMEAVSRPRSRP